MGYLEAFDQLPVRFASVQDKNELYEAICNLLQKPYWNRLWIAQEITASSLVNMRCGSFRINYRGLARYVAWCGNISGDPLPIQSKMELLTSYALIEDKRSMAEVLAALHDSICAEPRDKLYGILPLLDERIREDIEVNYARPIKKVFIDIVRRWSGACESVEDVMDQISPLLDLAAHMLPDLFSSATLQKLMDRLEAKATAEFEKAEKKAQVNQNKLLESRLNDEVDFGSFDEAPTVEFDLSPWLAKTVIESLKRTDGTISGQEKGLLTLILSDQMHDTMSGR